MLIDRYIGRAQLHAFVVVFVSLAGLYFVFDAFTNMEEFLSHAAETGSLTKVLASYYSRGSNGITSSPPCSLPACRGGGSLGP